MNIISAIFLANIFRIFRVVGEHPWVLFVGIALGILWIIIKAQVDKRSNKGKQE